MSIAALNTVWNASKSRLGSRLVMLALADYADERGHSFPSINKLMQKTALSERGVQESIKDLVDIGELTVKPNAGPNGVNIYCIIPPQNMRPADSDPRTECGSPPQILRKTPANSAPKPSGTTKEPPIRVEVVWPHILDTPKFRAAWKEWEAHRRELKIKAYTTRGMNAKLSELSALGHDRSLIAISHSIAGNYQGIFEPNGNGKIHHVAPASSAKREERLGPTPMEKLVNDTLKANE